MTESNILRQNRGQLPGELAVTAYSILGQRKSQQDFAGVLTDRDKVLAVLCDGMGGLKGGERASKTAVTMLMREFEKAGPESRFADFLCRQAVLMDTSVHALTTADGEPLNAGTTVVAAVASRDGQVEWMSVGDSRIYLLHGDTLTQLTRDHNYRCYLEDSLSRGKITREHYEKEVRGRMAEALTSYLGRGRLEQIGRSQNSLKLEPGDQLLLCSDGLYKSLNPHQIRAMLTDNRVDVRVSGKRLTDMALAQAVKTQDNTTIVLIQYLGRKTEE